jgi:hypothetical protein
MTLTAESIQTSRELADLMKRNEQREHEMSEAIEKQRAFDRFLATLAVEELLSIRWFIEHRHAADLAAIDLAISTEEDR